MTSRIVIIGLGGIGKHLLRPLARFLNFHQDEWHLILVDGDEYESGNATRQAFGNSQARAIVQQVEKSLSDLGLSEAQTALEPTLQWAKEQTAGLGNKAEITALELREEFPDLVIEAVPYFVAGADDEVREVWQGKTMPVTEVIREGDWVFLCVDNHKTRRTVSQYCENLRNAKLFSGGNDLTDGNVQVFIRKDGRNITPSLTATHPEIANPSDKAPHELSCEELAQSGTPQVLFANLTAATIMANAFYAELERKLQSEEFYFDILAGKVVPPIRIMPKQAQEGTAKKRRHRERSRF
ncbi:MAG: ThiF family adenylyltransferase [Deltaproteobacteria bacterium]|nr:ThiF family adenylyltransferase [Deltaproteobacteria bacterium]